MKKFFGFFNPFFLCVLDKGYNSVEDARNLFANGVSIELIAKSLNMTESEIRELTRDIVPEMEQSQANSKLRM